MNDPLIARFAEACGATAPLALRVDLADGCLLAEGSVAQPFTLVGRDDSCDVTLSDPEINPRHAWLQVLGGRVFAVDLGSRTGLKWPTGACGSGWLDVGTPARIGPFLLQLKTPVADRSGAPLPGSNPLAADPAARAGVPIALEFRNGKRAKDRWAVNRLITLIGRAPDCKIHLTADDISLYHCGLVNTRTGLWVVDLSGRGVVVNGERMRVAPLPHAAELWVGRFLIGCQHQPSPGTSGAASSSNGRGPSSSGKAARPAPLAPPRRAEDEVELGSTPDPADDLPASHILADAFRPWDGLTASGPPSNPITVGGSDPSPGAVPVPPDTPLAQLFGALGIDPTGEEPLESVLRQMVDLHARMSNEFDQWLALVSRLFARAKREYLPVVRHELNRIEDLTIEIAVLQSAVSRQALDAAATDRAKQTEPARADAHPPPEPWVPPSTRTPIPDTPPPHPRAVDPGSADRPLDQLRARRQERAARWQALIALFADG